MEMNFVPNGTKLKGEREYYSTNILSLTGQFSSYNIGKIVP